MASIPFGHVFEVCAARPGSRIAPTKRQKRITVPLFFGLLKVYLRKRTDLLAIAQEQQDALPAYFEIEMNKEDGVE